MLRAREERQNTGAARSATRIYAERERERASVLGQTAKAAQGEKFGMQSAAELMAYCSGARDRERMQCAGMTRQSPSEFTYLDDFALLRCVYESQLLMPPLLCVFVDERA